MLYVVYKDLIVYNLVVNCKAHIQVGKDGGP